MFTQTQIGRLRRDLLTHYEAHGRSLPWRIRPEDRARGVEPDPYAIWLSEIMLQQTTVAHGKDYWHRFLDTFPTVVDLANAPRDQVLSMWAGLGYYARARNLHKCAQIIHDEYEGVFPQSEAELLKLPGIGPYTAATMAAICYNEPTNIVDGNVERVISRLFTVQTPLPKGRKELRQLAGKLADPDRPGDYGQALMDLGSQVCSPRNPKCDMCPWAWACAAYKAGTQTSYPKKIKKTKLPLRYGTAFVLICQGHVFMQTRPDKGLLGGMLGFPGSEWGDSYLPNPLLSAPVKRNWEKVDGEVRHVFTHFDLRLTVYTSEMSKRPPLEGAWVPITDIDTHALPTVMKKVLKLAGIT